MRATIVVESTFWGATGCYVTAEKLKFRNLTVYRSLCGVIKQAIEFGSPTYTICELLNLSFASASASAGPTAASRKLWLDERTSLVLSRYVIECL
jgi:hypothetical protein